MVKFLDGPHCVRFRVFSYPSRKDRMFPCCSWSNKPSRDLHFRLGLASFEVLDSFHVFLSGGVSFLPYTGDWRVSPLLFQRRQFQLPSSALADVYYVTQEPFVYMDVLWSLGFIGPAFKKWECKPLWTSCTLRLFAVNWEYRFHLRALTLLTLFHVTIRPIDRGHWMIAKFIWLYSTTICIP